MRDFMEPSSVLWGSIALPNRRPLMRPAIWSPFRSYTNPPGKGSVPLHALGNVFQGLAGPGVATFLDREVSDRHDADQSVVVVDHGKPADLVLAHELGAGRGGHVGGRAHHVVALDVLHGAVEVAVGDGADHDVAVGHDADNATVLHHGHRARVLVAHDARGDLDVVARRHSLGIGG